MQRTNTARELSIITALFFAVVAIGTIFYHYAEGFGWINSLYFTSMTLTTVGYGDLVPQTDIGKLFTSVYAFLWVGLFLGMVGVVFHNTLEYSKDHSAKSIRQKDPAENLSRLCATF